MACPVIWPTEPRSPDFRDLLLRRWEETCKQFQLGYEASDYDFDHSDEDCDDDSSDDDAESLGSLRWDCDNVEKWIDRARQLYTTETRRFWALVVAGPRMHSKHYPSPTMMLSEIRAQTQRDGISLLYPGIRAALLSEVLWDGLGDLAANAQHEPSERLTEFWREAFSAARLRVAFDMLNPIGACYGKDSRYLCFEIDASAAVAHAYPVTREEAEDIAGGLPLPGLDQLQGFDQRRSDWCEAPAEAWGFLRPW